MASQPSAPDPYRTASAQNAQNAFASQFSNASNNANEVNPYGSVSYNQTGQTPIYTNGQLTGYSPQYTRTTTLSPDQQKLFGLETQSQYNLGNAGVTSTANLRDALSTPVDKSQWTPWQTSMPTQDIRQDTSPTDRQGIQDAMMASYNRTALPQINAQEASLAARGLAPGSAGYSQYQMQRDDDLANAQRQAYLASGSEARANQAAYNDAATQRFNMQQSANSYLNNLRGAQMQEAYQTQTQPLNIATALMSGSQATVPQFQAFQGSNVQPSNIASYINSNYQNQAQQAANTNAGLFGLGGGLAKLGIGML